MISITTEKQFNYLWATLCDNYNHSYLKTQSKKDYFYNSLKDNEFKTLKNVIKEIISENQYFPNLAEITTKVEIEKNLPEWMQYPELCKNTPPTDEEEKELNILIEELCL